MTAAVMDGGGFFCPSDRELALRGQIKTGWSTVAVRKKLTDMGLTLDETKKIQEVLKLAEEHERVERLRIGLQMMKYKQMSDNMRGDGATTCRVCGFNLVNQRSRRPMPMQFCQQCGEVVCPRCKSNYHCLSGGMQILCRICFEERELWKKSGAWLNHTLPQIDVSEEELEQFQQQQQQVAQRVALGRQEGSPTEFVTFSQLTMDDTEDDDDDRSSFSGSNVGINFGFSRSAPHSREGSPAHKRAFVNQDTAFAGTFPRSQGEPFGRARADSDSLAAPGFGKVSRLTRKGAMSGSRRKELEHSREIAYKRRAASLERSSRKRGARSTSPLLIARSRSPSPPSSRASESPPRPVSTTSGEDAGPPMVIRQQETLVSNPPTITIRRPSTPIGPHPHFAEDKAGTQSVTVAETRPTILDDSVIPVAQFGDEAMDLEHQKPSGGSIDHKELASFESPKDAPHQSTNPPNEDRGSFDVEVSKTHPDEPTRSPRLGRRQPVSTPPRQQKPEKKSEEDTPPLEDEFRKIKRRPQRSSGDKIPPKADEDTAQVDPTPEELKKVDFFKSDKDQKDEEKIPTNQPRRRSLGTIGKQDSITSTGSGGSIDKMRGTQSSITSFSSESSFDQMKGKQTSITSTDSESSFDQMRGVTLVSVDSQSGTQPSIESIPTIEVQSPPQPPAEPQQDPEPFHWRRKNARRITKVKPSSSQTVSATDDFEPVEVESFHYRSRSGAMSKSRTPESSEPMPGEFRKVKSPAAKSGGDILLERKQLSSRPRSYSGGGSSLDSHGGKRRARHMAGGGSVASEHGVYGSIQLSLEYSMADSLLRVTVHNCKGLRGVDFNGLSDPYIKLFLIPWHKKNYFKTSIVRKCLNPEYQESFILQGITHDVLEKKSLGIIVMDHDDFGSDNPLGAARIPLYEATGPEGMHLKKLLADLSSIRFPREGVESEEKGRILLTISYSAQDCTLTIGVDRALDLPAADSSGLADPYIKCILEVRARSMKTKTKTCMRDLNPTFNEELVFSIKQQDLPYCKLVVAVWHRKKVAKDVHLGKVVFQSPAFWQKYAMQPSYQQTEWHPLSDYKNLKD